MERPGRVALAAALVTTSVIADASAQVFDADGFATLRSAAAAEPRRLADTPKRDDRVVPAEAVEPRDGTPPAWRSEALLGVGVAPADEPVTARSAAFRVEKTAPGRVAVGRAYVYAISVKNVGDEPAASVLVEDLVPRGTRLEGTNPQARLEGKTLVWEFPEIEPGGERVVRVKVTPTAAGTVGSVATASFVSEVSSRTEVVAPALSLTTRPTERVEVGTPIELIVVVANGGRAAADGVVLRASLPPGLAHLAGNVVEHEVGTLAAGAERVVPIVVRPDRTGSFEIPVEVVATGGLRVTATARVETDRTAVVVTRDQPREVVAGQLARSTTTVENASDRPLAGGRLVERIPAGVTVIGTDPPADFDPNSSTVAWDVGPLSPGRSRAFAIDWAAADTLATDGAVRFDGPAGTVAELAPRYVVIPEPAPEVATVTLEPTRHDIPLGTRIRLSGRVDPGATALVRSGRVTIAVPAGLKLTDVDGLPRLNSYRGEAETLYFTDVDRPTGFEFELEAVRPGPVEVVVTTAEARAATPFEVTGGTPPSTAATSDFSPFE